MRKTREGREGIHATSHEIGVVRVMTRIQIILDSLNRRLRSKYTAICPSIGSYLGRVLESN